MKQRLLALLFPAALCACGEDTRAVSDSGSDAVLKFSAIPDQNTTELRPKFDAVARYLSAKLGIPVEYVPAAEYQASVDMFKNGDIQLAWFGGLTGLQARKAVPGARAIAQGQEDLAFVSYFIAHEDTGLERSDAFPTGIGELSFTFGSPDSTSGRLMPEHFIRQNTGKSPEELFGKQPGFQKTHDQTCEAVGSGQYQVGAVNYSVYDRRVQDGTTDPSVCKVIWKSPTYADYNFTAHPDLEAMFGAGFVDKLQRALCDMKDPELLRAFPRSALVEAENSDFDGLAEVAKSLGML